MVDKMSINKTRKVTVTSYGDNVVFGKAQDGEIIEFSFHPGYQECPEVNDRVTVKHEGNGKWIMD